jgi:hypothetical protein
MQQPWSNRSITRGSGSIQQSNKCNEYTTNIEGKEDLCVVGKAASSWTQRHIYVHFCGRPPPSRTICCFPGLVKFIQIPLVSNHVSSHISKHRTSHFYYSSTRATNSAKELHLLCIHEKGGETADKRRRIYQQAAFLC